MTGGENVYSTEVEDVLYRHPAVLEAAVFGIPDERWGEAVHAVVVPRADVTADELIAFCHGVDRRLQGAEGDRDPQRAAAEVGGGQGAQAGAARAALGGAGVDGVGGVKASAWKRRGRSAGVAVRPAWLFGPRGCSAGVAAPPIPRFAAGAGVASRACPARRR